MKKKSRAAQRIVSLMLALGLIFTLVPASVFADDEVVASSTVVTAAEEEPTVEATEPAEEVTEPAEEVTEPAEEVTEPAEEATEPAEETTEPAEEATEPAEEGTEPAEEATEPTEEGTEPAEEATEPTEEGTEPAEEATEPTEEGTEPAEEGTVPAEEILSPEQAALLVASAPAVMSEGPQEASAIESVFTFSNSSSDHVQVAYAFDHSRPIGSVHISLKSLPKGESFTRTMLANDTLAFFIKVDDGFDISSFEGGAGNYQPLATAAALEGLEDDYERARVEGYDYVFTFESLGVRDIEFVIKTTEIENTCTVTVNDQVLTGSNFEPVLPHNVEKGGSVTVTLKESTVYPMLTLSVNGESLNLPWNLEKDDPAVTTLKDGTVVSVTYKTLVGGYTYEITFSNVQSDLVISDYSVRQITEKGIVITDITGASVFYKDEDSADYTQAEKNTRIPLDFDFAWDGQVRATYFLVKLAQDYEEPLTVTLTKKAGDPPITKTATYDSSLGGYVFEVTRGIIGSGADIEIAAGGDEYVVGLAVKATPKQYPHAENTSVVYNGQQQELKIVYPEGKSAADYIIEYKGNDDSWIKGIPSSVNVCEMNNIQLRFTPIGSSEPYVDPTLYTFAVTQRHLVLNIQNAEKFEGDPNPVFSYTSTEGQGLATGDYIDSTTVMYSLTDNPDGSKKIDIVSDYLQILRKVGNNLELVNPNYDITVNPGTLTVKQKPALPAELQPEKVIGVNTVYDGTKHEIEIQYKDPDDAKHFTVTYQTKVNKDDPWSEPTETPPSSVDVVASAFYVRVTFTHNSGLYAPYVVGDHIGGENDDSVRFVITPRTVVLTVSNESKTDGQSDPSFKLSASAEPNNPDSGLLSGHSVQDGWTVTVKSHNVGQKNVVELNTNSVRFVDENGNLVNINNYAISPVSGSLTINPVSVNPTPDPDPDPNPTPTPVPTPVPTPTPAPVPVARVTRDDEEEVPEVIEEEETPQASPDTEDDKTETIEDEETAQAAAPSEGSWAFLNLILAALTVVAGLSMLVLHFARKTGMAHMLGIVPAIIALVVFFVTEDMSLPVAMTDKWTLIMAIIALVQLALLLLGRNSAQDEEHSRKQYQ